MNPPTIWIVSKCLAAGVAVEDVMGALNTPCVLHTGITKTVVDGFNHTLDTLVLVATRSYPAYPGLPLLLSCCSRTLYVAVDMDSAQDKIIQVSLDRYQHDFSKVIGDTNLDFTEILIDMARDMIAETATRYTLLQGIRKLIDVHERCRDSMMVQHLSYVAKACDKLYSIYESLAPRLPDSYIESWSDSDTDGDTDAGTDSSDEL